MQIMHGVSIFFFEQCENEAKIFTSELYAPTLNNECNVCGRVRTTTHDYARQGIKILGVM